MELLGLRLGSDGGREAWQLLPEAEVEEARLPWLRPQQPCWQSC